VTGRRVGRRPRVQAHDRISGDDFPRIWGKVVPANPARPARRQGPRWRQGPRGARARWRQGPRGARARWRQGPRWRRGPLAILELAAFDPDSSGGPPPPRVSSCLWRL